MTFPRRPRTHVVRDLLTKESNPQLTDSPSKNDDPAPELRVGHRLTPQDNGESKARFNQATTLNANGGDATPGERRRRDDFTNARQRTHEARDLLTKQPNAQFTDSPSQNEYPPPEKCVGRSLTTATATRWGQTLPPHSAR